MARPELPVAQSGFRYRALDAQGNSRQGELRATDEAAAARELLVQGLTPLALEPLVAPVPSVRRLRAPRPADQHVFLRELATLLQAGISANEALPSLAEAYRGQAVGPAAQRLETAVRGGRSIAQAIADSGLGLPPFAQALIDAGDASGRLGEACADAAAQIEHELRLRGELRNALIYPSILVGAGTLAVLIILIGVVPRFAGVLRNPRAEVPDFSRWIIETGVFLQQHWFNLGLALAVLLGVLALLARAPGVRERFQSMLSDLPLVGPWLIEAETGRWAQLLGTLLLNKVPIVKALGLASAVISLSPLRRALARCGQELETGAMLSDLLARERWFPPTRLNLIRVGERSGELAGMLQRLGTLQIEASRQRQKRLLALVEPVSILIIGTVIGFIMAGVMMAITSLNTMAA